MEISILVKVCYVFHVPFIVCSYYNFPHFSSAFKTRKLLRQSFIYVDDFLSPLDLYSGSAMELFNCTYAVVTCLIQLMLHFMFCFDVIRTIWRQNLAKCWGSFVININFSSRRYNPLNPSPFSMFFASLKNQDTSNRISFMPICSLNIFL